MQNGLWHYRDCISEVHCRHRLLIMTMWWSRNGMAVREKLFCPHVSIARRTQQKARPQRRRRRDPLMMTKEQEQQNRGALCNLPVEDSSSSSSASTRTPLIIMVQHASTRPSVQYMDGWSLVVMRQSFPATNTQTPSTTTRDDISRFVNAKLMVKSFIIFRDHFCYNPQYNYGLYGIIIIPPSVHVAAFWSECDWGWLDWNGCASCCSSQQKKSKPLNAAAEAPQRNERMPPHQKLIAWGE